MNLLIGCNSFGLREDWLKDLFALCLILFLDTQFHFGLLQQRVCATLISLTTISKLEYARMGDGPIGYFDNINWSL